MFGLVIVRVDLFYIVCVCNLLCLHHPCATCHVGAINHGFSGASIKGGGAVVV
jgi:hypothetical protein